MFDFTHSKSKEKLLMVHLIFSLYISTAEIRTFDYIFTIPQIAILQIVNSYYNLQYMESISLNITKQLAKLNI